MPQVGDTQAEQIVESMNKTVPASEETEDACKEGHRGVRTTLSCNFYTMKI